MAQSNQLPHHAYRFGVFTCFDSLPRHTAAAIGIIAQADADVKGAATNPDYALERMVLGILRQKRA